MILTEENILNLVPNGNALEKAKPFTKPKKWRNLEGNEKIIWGECKSSGASYYKTVIHAQKSHFYCNCPSQVYSIEKRGKLCKHTLALALIYVGNPGIFKFSPKFPNWVSNRLEEPPKYGQKAERTAEKEHLLAQQRIKTREKRLFQMEAGFKELSIWLEDIMRQGLAVLDGQSDDVFTDISERMVNAKLGSLGRRIRNLSQLIGQKDWHEKLLSEIGDIYLLVKGFKNLEKLPSNLQQELLSVSGINFKKEELAELEGIKDTWFIIGQTEGTDDSNLFFRRTWIIGKNTQLQGMILDFAWGANPYENNWKIGTQFFGEIVFYPSAYPMRVFVKNFEMTISEIVVKGFEDFYGFSNKYAEAVGQNPWLALFPVFLENVIPLYQNEEFFLVDRDKNLLPVLEKEGLGWKMLALSGGQPVHVFGQWDGLKVELFSVVLSGDFHVLQDVQPLKRPKNKWNNW